MFPGLYCPLHSRKPCTLQDGVLSLSRTARQELSARLSQHHRLATQILASCTRLWSSCMMVRCSLPRGTTHQNQRWSTVLSPRGSPVHVAENTQSCQYYIKRRPIESHARHQEHTRIGLYVAFPTASVRQLRWRSVMDDIPRRNRPGKCLGTALSTFSI